MEKIDLQLVRFMPMDLLPGILYVSEEYKVAGHLCPCGCGNKVITPLGPTEWSFTLEDDEPTLDPSIGSWQLPCRSHYWIRAARIEWSYQWSDREIEAGRKAEERRRKRYYDELAKANKTKDNVVRRFINWIYSKINTINKK